MPAAAPDVVGRENCRLGKRCNCRGDGARPRSTWRTYHQIVYPDVGHRGMIWCCLSMIKSSCTYVPNQVLAHIPSTWIVCISGDNLTHILKLLDVQTTLENHVTGWD